MLRHGYRTVKFLTLAISTIAVVSAFTPAQTAKPSPTPLPHSEMHRWFDVEALILQTRYRYIQNANGLTANNQQQWQFIGRGRFKFDRKAKYSVVTQFETGNSFTAGWNNTGIGTGDPVHALSVKQLYFGAVPWGGVEVSYGGLAPIRGESTEITSYDNDGYMVGERVSLRRPKDLFFDEISATAGFLGDVETPNVFRRLDRLGEINYGQILASKKATSWLTASADVTRVSNVSTVRAAATVGVAASNILDTVRYEQYARTGEDAAFGYAVTAEKALGRRLTAGLGYADIDQNYGGLNGDRYGSGRRLFETGGIRLWSALSLAMFATQAFHDDVAISNHQRVDVVLTYNVLATLKRAGLIR